MFSCLEDFQGVNMELELSNPTRVPADFEKYFGRESLRLPSNMVPFAAGIVRPVVAPSELFESVHMRS